MQSQKSTPQLVCNKGPAQALAAHCLGPCCPPTWPASRPAPHLLPPPPLEGPPARRACRCGSPAGRQESRRGRRPRRSPSGLRGGATGSPAGRHGGTGMGTSRRRGARRGSARSRGARADSGRRRRAAARGSRPAWGLSGSSNCGPACSVAAFMAPPAPSSAPWKMARRCSLPGWPSQSKKGVPWRSSKAGGLPESASRS